MWESVCDLGRKENHKMFLWPIGIDGRAENLVQDLQDWKLMAGVGLDLSRTYRIHKVTDTS